MSHLEENPVDQKVKPIQHKTGHSEVDAVVIGCGYGGIYAMHKLRDELKLDVRGFDAAGGPGGTWWWNRYPGARCDVESIYYSYSFSDEIQRGWTWSERYSAQPEILRYLEWVADKLDVPRSYRFNTKITSMVWDERRNRWLVGTDSGEQVAARFVVSASGNVSVEKDRSLLTGIENFKGKVYFTGTWPHDEVDFSGQRVGIIGTGASGIQAIQELARTAKHLTVFQRTPNYAVPSRNKAVGPEQQRWNAEHWRELRGNSRGLNFGTNYPKAGPSAFAVTPEERKAHYDANWKHGGLQIIASSYGDVLLDERANETLAEYIREQIRERVNDPETAELLCPKSHPYGTKRPPLEDGYYEVFNQDNVKLVDVSDAGKPITEVTENAIRTIDTDYELDAIVLATGFDAFSGALMSMGIVGRGGKTLAEDWSDGPHTYLGISSAGFPNLFTITGPTCAVAFYNNPLAIEDHVEFAANAITRTLSAGAEVFEVDRAAEDAWMKMAHGVLHLTLMPKAKSWYMGANIPGKPIATWVWPLGAPLYRAMLADVVNHDYAGIRIGNKPAGREPPMLRVEPTVALVLGAMLEDAKPPEDMTLEDTRAMMEQFVMVQKPAPDSVEVIETSFSGPTDERPLRIYRPRNAQGPLPVVVFYHGGGFIAGSINSCAAPCANLAKTLQAVVVSPSYRLAPEHPFPAATDDTYAALCWVAEEIAQYGGDPERIVVMGESAGGTLAAVAAQRARDEGGPALAGQILLNPGIDIDPNANTASRTEYQDGPVLTMDMAKGMLSAYLGDLANAASPLASPSKAKTLAELPPALIITSECDPLRDEGEDYARALHKAGVKADILRLKGLVHGVYNMSAFVPRTTEIDDAVKEFFAHISQRRGVVA